MSLTTPEKTRKLQRAFYAKAKEQPSYVEAWAQRGATRGVIFLTAQSFAFDGRSQPYVRLGFGGLTETQIREAEHRMVSAF